MKTKVIAFRVTQEEYNALYFMSRTKGITVAEHVNECMTPAVNEAHAALAKELKKAEAKAKREAKKAAANAVQ